MSARSDSNRNEATIARSGKRKWGYDTKQVDAFLQKAHALYESEDPSLSQNQISNAAFDLCKDGYTFNQVDAALARLQRAVADRIVSEEVNRTGLNAWTGQMVRLYTALRRHADRESGLLFARGRDGFPSYDRKQVDRLVSQILARAAYELNMDQDSDDRSRKKLVDITSDRVSNVIFTQRRGKRGYDERQVDYYLSRCVELLQQLESIAKLDLNGEEESPAQSQTQTGETDWTSEMTPEAEGRTHQTGSDLPSPGGDAGTQTEVIKPLIGQAQSPAWESGVPETSASMHSGSGQVPQDQFGHSSSDFAQLHQAEQAIFDLPHTGESGARGVGSEAPTPPVLSAEKTSGDDPESLRGQSNKSLGNLARSVRSQESVSDEGNHSGEESLNKDGQSQTPAGHDWSISPSFGTPPVNVLANQPRHDSTSSGSSPSEEVSSVKKAEGQSPVQTEVETSQDQMRSAGWNQPAPTEPEQSEGESGSSQNQSNQDQEDPDSYLASLLAVDLPRMDLDIPDISFPGLSTDQDGKNDSDRNDQGQDQDQ